MNLKILKLSKESAIAFVNISKHPQDQTPSVILPDKDKRIMHNFEKKVNINVQTLQSVL